VEVKGEEKGRGTGSFLRVRASNPLPEKGTLQSGITRRGEKKIGIDESRKCSDGKISDSRGGDCRANQRGGVVVRKIACYR